MRDAAGTAPAAGSPDPAAQYRAGRTAVILADRPDLERVLFRGKDAADLIHRLSTNAIKGLREGEGVATVFTTNKGRILDLVTVHRIAEGLLGLCAGGRAAVLRDWVERYTFREEVTADDWTGSHRTLGLYGPRASVVAGRLFGAAAAALPLHGVMAAASAAGPLILARTFPLGGEGFLITVPAGVVAALRAAIHAGAGEPLVEAGPACIEVLRIEAGLPAAGSELNDEHNPWEARLQDAISLTKGCYVGQEVIARLNTYKKVARQLVRITSSAPPGAGTVPAGPPAVAGQAIRGPGGETIGVVTSGAVIPDGSGRVVALGYVRDEDAAAGQAVGIEHAGGTIPAIIEGVAR